VNRKSVGHDLKIGSGAQNRDISRVLDEIQV